MASAAKDFSFLFNSKIVILVLGIVTQSGLARLLEPAGRGSYAVCCVFSTLLGVVFILGCDLACQYYVASKRFSPSEGVLYTFIYGLGGSGLAIGAGLLIMRFPLAFLSKASPSEFYLALASIPVSILSLSFLELLTSVKEFGWFSLISVVSSVVQFLSVLLFVWVLPWGVKGALLACICSGLVCIVMPLFIFRFKYGLTWVCPTFKNLYEMLHYGVRYYFGKISKMVNLQMGTVIIAFFATREQVGLFDIAVSLTSKVMMIPDTLMTLLIPRVASEEAGHMDLLTRCIRLVAIVCGFALFILAIFAKPIVYVLFSSTFFPAVPLIQILTIGFLVRSIGKIFIPYLLGKDHPGLASIGEALGMAVNLAGLWVLLPLTGLVGGAWAMNLGFFVSSGILGVGFIRISGLKWRTVFSFKRSDWAELISIWDRVYRRISINSNPAK